MSIKKIRVKTPMPPKTQKEPMYFPHTTSASFMRPGVAHFTEVVPDQQIDLDVSYMLRFDPMLKPFLGAAKLNLRAFFVPYRVINKSWESFVADTEHQWASGGNASVPDSERVFDIYLLFMMFFNRQYALTTVTKIAQDSLDPRPTVFDWMWEDPDFEYYYVLTSKGRDYYRILCQLGYRVPLRPYGSEIEEYVSLQPLLSLARVFCDWYYPASYAPIMSFRIVRQFIAMDSLDGNHLNDDFNMVSYSYPDGSSFNVGGTGILFYLLDVCRFATYDLDYFNSAFDNPDSPNMNLASSFTIQDPVMTSTISNVQDDGFDPTDPSANIWTSNNAVIKGGDYISQFSINILNALSNFLRRNMLVGSRVVDRLLARFGINNTPTRLDRSILISSASCPISIGDVMSHADTDVPLGAFAGQGFSKSPDGGLKFSFSNDSPDYGMLFIVYNLLPMSMYCQGMRREVLNTQVFDHWSPDFDGRSSDAIAKCQLLVKNDVREPGSAMDTEIYGFTRTYSWAKFGFANLTGNFAVPSVNVDGVLDAWHMQRLINPQNDMSDLVHGIGSLVASDSEQYSRIFFDQSGSLDNVTIHFVTVQQNTDHMLGAFDDYMLLHNEFGKDISVHNQGSTLN